MSGNYHDNVLYMTIDPFLKYSVLHSALNILYYFVFANKTYICNINNNHTTQAIRLSHPSVAEIITFFLVFFYIFISPPPPPITSQNIKFALINKHNRISKNLEQVVLDYFRLFESLLCFYSQFGCTDFKIDRNIFNKSPSLTLRERPRSTCS